MSHHEQSDDPEGIDDLWELPIPALAARFGALHPEDRNSNQVEYIRMVLQAADRARVEP